MSALADLPLISSGKVREIYDLEDRLLLVASDRVSTYDVVHPTTIPDKGSVLTGLSAFWFDLTEEIVPNHVISVTDGLNNTTHYAYDADNEQTQATRADGTTTRTSYDADGNVLTQTDGNDHSTTYTYDPLNRVTILVQSGAKRKAHETLNACKFPVGIDIQEAPAHRMN